MRSGQLLRIASLALAVCTTLVLLAVVWQLREAVVLCSIAIGMASALEPLIERLALRGVRKAVRLSLVYFGVGLLAFAIPAGVASPIVAEFSSLATSLTQVNVAELRAEGPLQHWLLDNIPWVKSVASEYLASGDAAAFWGLLGFTWGAFEAFGNLIVVFVLSLYWSADGEHFERLWLSLLSVEHRSAVRELWRTIQAEVGAYLRSEAVQALLAGCLLGLGYSLIGFPYPALLASISAVAWLVPWGGIVIAITATVVLSIPTILSMGDYFVWTNTLPTALYTLVVLSILEYFVEPRFFNRNRYNSLLVLLVVIVFTETFGITGLILAPPAAAAMQIVARFYIRQRAMQNATTEGLTLERRIDTIWRAVEQIDEAPPELVSILDRLARLAHHIRQSPQPNS